MSRYISDEALRRAAAELAEARLAAQPSPEECGHEFSPAFQRAMEKLLQKGKRKAVWRRVASIAASLLLVLAIGGGIVLAVSPEARAAVVNWLREQYENSIIYRFWGGGETSEFPTYRVGWLPDGCNLVDETIEDGLYVATYGPSVEDTRVVFHYGDFETIGSMTIFDDDISSAQRLTINGMPGEYIPFEDGSGGDLIWIDEGREITFSISSVLDKDTTIRIAESVTETGGIQGFASGSPACRFGWLPEGYELLQEIEGPPYVALYQSANGSNQIIFSFGTFEEMKNMVISGDDISNREELTIQGAHGEYIPDEDGQGGDLVWIDEKREIAFAISSSLDKDTTIKIAENILQK